MRRLVGLWGLAAVLAGSSCQKNPPPSTAPTRDDGDATASTDPGSGDAATDLPERFAKELARQQKRADEIRARWTPQLRAQITALTEKPWPSTEAAMAEILKSPHRAPGNAARDVYRHPAQTLAFFGLTPSMRVFEYAQGAGWYTEILAPLLAHDGVLHLTGYDDSSGDPQLRFGAAVAELFLTAPGNLYDKVVPILQKDLGGGPNLGEPDSLDMILVFRMMHNFHRFKMWDSFMPAAHAALKPGGVLAVVQHRANDDADPDQTAPKGYLPEPWLVDKVQSYGFELEARSDINANPKDTKDHEKGVWTLPPTLELGDKDRDKYLAIGESDRSTLKFVKVAKR